MKNRSLIFIAFLCFLAVSAFSQERGTTRQINRVSVNWEIVNLLKNSENNLSQLFFFISSPLTIVIRDDSIEPSYQINNGNLLFSEQYLDLMRVDLTVNHAGRLHVFHDKPAGNEIIEIIFTLQNRFVTLKFARNVHQDCFDLFSAIINGKPYNLSSETGLPKLMIISNFDLR